MLNCDIIFKLMRKYLDLIKIYLMFMILSVVIIFGVVGKY